MPWDEELEICPNGQYLKLSGQTFVEWENLN